MIRKLFLYLDMFAEPVSLSLQGQTRFRTMWGATISLFLLVLLVFILWSSVLAYENGTIKKVLFSEIYESNSNYVLQSENFIFEVLIQDNSSEKNLDQYFQVKFIRSNDIYDQDLLFNVSVIENQNGLFYKYTLLNGQKLEIKNDVSFRTAIKLKNQTLVQIRIQSSLINQQNAFETFIQSQTMILTKGLTKIVPIEIRRVKRQEEPEIFQFMPEPTNSFYSNFQSEQVVFNENSQEMHLLEVQVFLNNIIQCYDIELFGILDIMSGFGGIYQFIFSFILLVLRPLNRIMQRYILVTALFDFQDKVKPLQKNQFRKRNAISNNTITQVIRNRTKLTEETKRDKGRRSTAFQNLKTQIQNATDDIQDQISVIPMLLELKKCQIQDKITAYFKEIQKDLSLSLPKYIKYRFFYCSQKNKNKRNILGQTETHIMQHIDIYYVVRKLAEIDKLKMLLLSNDQIKLFDYLPKQVIDLNKDFDMLVNNLCFIKNKKQQGLLQSEVTNLKSIIDAQQAYQAIFKTEENNIINQRLIKTLDPDIVDLFKISTVKAHQEQEFKVNEFIQIDKNSQPQVDIQIQQEEIENEQLDNVQEVKYFTPHTHTKSISPPVSDSIQFYHSAHIKNPILIKNNQLQ